MSLEKDLKTILESIGGSGTFPTGGFKLDPATGFAQDRRRKTGSVTVPTPASAGDLKPAGYDTHNILGRSVKIPYFDDHKMFGKMRATQPQEEPRTLGSDAKKVGQGAVELVAAGIEYMGREGRELLQYLGYRDDENPTADEIRKRIEAQEPTKPGYMIPRFRVENTQVRREEIKNIINEQAAGRAVSSLLNKIPGQGPLGKGVNIAFGYSLIQNLLGASDEQMTDLFGTGISTTPRGPEGVLAKTRKLKARTGGELSQEGPRSKRIKKKVKGTLETRRSKERAARK